MAIAGNTRTFGLFVFFLSRFTEKSDHPRPNVELERSIIENICPGKYANHSNHTFSLDCRIDDQAIGICVRILCVTVSVMC